MSKLVKLITFLERTTPKGLKDHKLVLSTLCEIRDMVGNDATKDTIASQVMYLMSLKEKGQDKKLMLNTIIYGGQGMGKTKFGCKLAAIWYGLGYLQAPKATVASKLPSIADLQNGEYAQYFMLLTYLILFISILWIPLIKVYNMMNRWVLIVLIFILLILVVYAYMVWTSRKEDIQTEARVESPVNSTLEHTDIVRVVSRSDFVGQYMGWTEKKTKALLEESLGKVLFIDEAYTLYVGPHDQYGMEAAAIINQFLSEHPNEIIVIFAGYRDQLQSGLFTIQPGLARRCMFHLEIKDYTSDQLFQIFKRQLGHEGFSLDSPMKIEELFKENYDAFPSFGGDCERLVNFCMLEYTEDRVTGESEENVICIGHVTRGIETLKKNNIHRNRTIGGSNQERDLRSLLSQFDLHSRVN